MKKYVAILFLLSSLLTSYAQLSTQVRSYRAAHEKELLLTFKTFLLNEQQAYLAQKVGNILSAVQDLKNDAKTMGSKNLNAFSNEKC